VLEIDASASPPLTRVGTFASEVPPFPSWPNKFEPQQYAFPLLPTEQDWRSPASSDTSTRPVAVNVKGLLLTAALTLSDCPPGVVLEPSTHAACAQPSAPVATI